MNLEPPEQPKGSSVQVQRMYSVAELYTNETNKEAFPTQQDFVGVHLVQHCCMSLDSAFSYKYLPRIT